MIKRDFTDTIMWPILWLAAIAAWALPMWCVPGMTGISDWDSAGVRFEAVRRTVLEFGQWPGHNPWLTGGVPLLGNPAMDLLSIKGLFVMIFGTFWGLRLSVLIYMFIGFIGAWKLAGIWWRDSFIKSVFSFYVLANPALIYHLSVGHQIFLNYYFMPLFMYFFLRFKEDKWSGLKAAVVFGIAFNDSPGYMVQYAALILICLSAYFFISDYKENSRMLRRWLVLFVPLCAALTFYRTMTILPLAFDFPRVANLKVHFNWLGLLKLYFVPYIKLGAIFPVDKYSGLAYPWEVCSYTGIMAFFLFLLSFRRGFRWWQAMTILLVWACSGNDSCFHIMYWIQKIPSFSSHACFTRIRMFTLLFFGIAAVGGLNYLWTKYKEHNIRFLRYVIIGIGIFMIAEPLVVSHLIMKSSHVRIAPWTGDNPANKFQNISSLSWPNDTPGNIKNYVNLTYRAIRMNLGWLRGFGDSYINEDTVRIGRDEPGYMGEFHQSGKDVEPIFWSPNKIVFKKLDPGVPLVVNMNPGNPWYNNGQQLFPEYRIVEPSKPFEVMPNEKGVVELTYRHPGQKTGIIGTIVLLIIAGFVVVQVKYRLLGSKSTISSIRGKLA